jgi:phage N-6-adenine-methyltransferase
VTAGIHQRAVDRSVALAELRDDWETPPALFQAYDRLYHFTLDVAANSGNALCRQYFDAEQDGLQQPWSGVVWCHPPHSTAGYWMAKARREAMMRTVTVVALVPVDTGAAWWHGHVQGSASIRFLKGVPDFRLRKLPATVKLRKLPSLPFAIVVYKPGRTL